MLDERPDPKGGWVSTRERIAEFVDHPDRLPAELPTLVCKQRCQSECRNPPVTPVEQARIAGVLGSPLTVDVDGVCSALTGDGGCAVYEVRPMSCRVWGLAESMMCPHGCVTSNGKYLEVAEVVGLAALAEEREGELHVPPTVDGGLGLHARG